MIRYSCLLAFAVFVSSPAWAGLYLEPYAGVETGSLKASATITAPASGTLSKSNDMTGFGYGAKVGYSFFNAVIGADYMGMSANSGGSENMQNLGIFAQVSIPMIVKFSATYFLTSSITNPADKNTGNGFKIGVGYLGLPLIAVNLDYMALSYPNDTPPSGTTYTGFSETVSGLFVSVSLPLDI